MRERGEAGRPDSTPLERCRSEYLRVERMGSGCWLLLESVAPVVAVCGRRQRQQVICCEGRWIRTGDTEYSAKRRGVKYCRTEQSYTPRSAISSARLQRPAGAGRRCGNESHRVADGIQYIMKRNGDRARGMRLAPAAEPAGSKGRDSASPVWRPGVSERSCQNRACRLLPERRDGMGGFPGFRPPHRAVPCILQFRLQLRTSASSPLLSHEDS